MPAAVATADARVNKPAREARMKNDAPRQNDISQFHVDVCDTEFYPVREGFAAFRQAIAGAFLPWIMEGPSDSEFTARIASFSTEVGSFGHTRMSPLTGIRNKAELAKSPEQCLYANYVMSGELFVEQGDTITAAKKGDLVIFDSTLPVRHVKVGDDAFEDLTFSISKNHIGSVGQIFKNFVVPHSMILPPLAGCFKFLSQNILSASPEELLAVGAACAALLPLAAGYCRDDHRNEVLDHASKRYDREMLKFIHHSLADERLSPNAVAEHLGISVRYVHKRFAAFGMTFGNYVRSKRLELVRHDLISEAGGNQPISVVAFRWGFSDLSTFIRAFKKEFGCTPREYRDRHGHGLS
jgi:AraC family transcriptional regulator, positive regulator of tynA and feaB